MANINMHILAIVTGEYGHRHVSNLQAHAPKEWKIEVWEAPTVYPLIIDYPEDFVPNSLPQTDLILSLGEHRGVAELIPEIAAQTGAKAVIAPIDNEAWLPRGLARQLRGWLEQVGVACVTPKPLCSLTESRYSLGRRNHIDYDVPLIKEFAQYFGEPDINLTIDPDTRTIVGVNVVRDAVCGCARFVAEGLIGISVDDAEQQAGLRHHHFPCLASMGIDGDYDDTLMHISGNLMKENIAEQVRPYKNIRYIIPGNISSSGQEGDELISDPDPDDRA